MGLHNLDSLPRGLLCFVLVISFCDGILAQSLDKHVQPTKAQWDEVITRGELIKEQLGKPGNPAWAGHYHLGSLGYVGATLWMAPKVGYVYRPYSDCCTTEIDEGFDYGTVEELDGVIHLRSERKIFSYDRFYFIPWGERHLLMPEENLSVLFNFINAGCAEFQTIDKLGNMYFPTKADEVRKKLTGKPALRKEFDKFLLPSPVTAKIVAVGKSRIEKQFRDSPDHRWFNRYTSVTLNVGSSKGIWPGMLMVRRVTDIPDAYMRMQIRSVSENSAEGEINLNFQGKEPPLPSIGLEFKTKFEPIQQGQSTAPWECR